VYLWSSTACEISIISHLLLFCYLFTELFLCFRSSNKDPGAGRGESLSMKEHGGEIMSLIYSLCGVY
jgi:hypothetical protein